MPHTRAMRSPRRSRAQSCRLNLEILEGRHLLATFTVDSIGDGADSDITDTLCDDGTGVCTLRAAIEQANASAGSDTIDFQIGGASPHTIRPGTLLPEITDAAILDGTTQLDFAGRPVVELDGSGAGAGAVALRIIAGPSTVRGFAINRFASDAIQLGPSGGNVVEGNFIGTDVTGTIALGNGADGVFIFNGSSANRIGTNGDGVNDAAEGNLISGNGQAGIRIFGPGADDNNVAGNRIGTDVTGSVPLGNTFDGVAIQGGAQRNRIGTNGDGVADVAERNLISANLSSGVRIHDSGSDDNVVAGNFLGTDITGTLALGNNFDGVAIHVGAQRNRVGTNGDGIADAEERNIISGNRRFQGVVIVDPGTAFNVVAGNFIGTDVSGTFSLGNGDNGVLISAGAANNLVGTNGDGVADFAERNIISANLSSGVRINGVGSDDNVVAGNFLGTDLTGTMALGNHFDGVAIHAGAQRNRVGTNGDGVADAEERNVIAGNRKFHGVVIVDPGTDFNVVAGNFIGTDVSGTRVLDNADTGVAIANGAQSNRVGTDADGVEDFAERNVISGNQHFGVAIFGEAANDNVVAGNFIGTDVSGARILANGFDGVLIQTGAAGNVIGGRAAAARNIISGNNSGVRLTGLGVFGNRIEGNFIGTDLTGTIDLGNSINGVGMDNGASFNTIGGVAAGAGNLISGNYGGVRIVTEGTVGNTVEANLIGTDVTGTADLGNTEYGVLIDFDASRNTIGGATEAARNVISGNDGQGVRLAVRASFNEVSGNFIGTDVTGFVGLGNSANGVLVDAGAVGNRIGVFEAGVFDFFSFGVGNVIAGNELNGVAIVGGDTASNEVRGNRIGTDAAGTAAIGNRIDGVQIVDAPNNTVGGFSAGARNIISGNGSPTGGSGIAVFGATATRNRILGNFIGTDVTGTVAIGNAFQGVALNSPFNQVGEANLGAGNVISGNGQHGVALFGAGASGNDIKGNFVGTDPAGVARLGNTLDGILLIDGASNNTIGAADSPGSFARNHISANGASGIEISGAATTGNLVQDNFIGVDPFGAVAIGNAFDGIHIHDGASGNTIGGAAEAAGNFIAGNHANGLRIAGANGNLVQRNFIGDFRRAALGNALTGVLIVDDASNNTIGGAARDAWNLIAFNGQAAPSAGVHVRSGSGNAVLGNFIFSNSGLGIDLGVAGVDTNDPGDGDTGANNVQNFPELLSATRRAGRVAIAGRLNSTPNRRFRVELFTNAALDPSGHGEGEFLGSVVVKTDDVGNAAFRARFRLRGPDLPFITATATDPTSNTSEFSGGIPVRVRPRIDDDKTRAGVAVLARDTAAGAVYATAVDILLDEAAGHDVTGRVRVTGSGKVAALRRTGRR